MSARRHQTSSNKSGNHQVRKRSQGAVDARKRSVSNTSVCDQSDDRADAVACDRLALKGSLFVISAPSGAGKTTILRPIFNELSALAFSVSHTTRPPRTGEQNGVDYHFVSKDEFLRLEQQGDFLEWAQVHGNYYGTSKSAVTEKLNRGVDIILDIDVQGASQLRGLDSLPATYIFIAPPSLSVLRQRLSDRHTESAETLDLRLKNAVNELKSAATYDYIIVNDVLADAIQVIKAIIIAKRAASRRGIDGAPLSLELLNT